MEELTSEKELQKYLNMEGRILILRRGLKRIRYHKTSCSSLKIHKSMNARNKLGTSKSNQKYWFFEPHEYSKIKKTSRHAKPCFKCNPDND